jgi:Na+/glutamate symporter
MVNLYTLPTYVVVLFIGVILCLFLAVSCKMNLNS